MSITVFEKSIWTPIDTAALSIWVDHQWFMETGGQMEISDNKYSARAADGSNIDVSGSGWLNFSLWGKQFQERVRIMNNLPDKVLMGRKFWR